MTYHIYNFIQFIFRSNSHRGGGLSPVEKSEIGAKRITIFNWGDIDNTLKENNVGDIVTYVTNNQMGLKIYKIVLDDNNKKTLEGIGDINGLYEDPEHPDYIDEDE